MCRLRTKQNSDLASEITLRGLLFTSHKRLCIIILGEANFWRQLFEVNLSAAFDMHLCTYPKGLFCRAAASGTLDQMKAIALFLVMIVIPSLAESDPDLSQGDIVAAIDQRLARSEKNWEHHYVSERHTFGS